MKKALDELAYRLAVFWFLNDDLNPDELRSQLRAMHEHGLGGTFIHWINNGPGYMNETWLKAVDCQELSKSGGA